MTIHASPLITLIYTSTALSLNDSQVYQKIALSSAKYNESREITGLLLVYNGLITQILEGRAQVVDELYSRIAVDQRHKSPIVLHREAISARDFPHWSMGYQDIDNDDNERAVFNLTLASLQRVIPKGIPHTASSLISSFAKTSGLIEVA